MLRCLPNEAPLIDFIFKSHRNWHRSWSWNMFDPFSNKEWNYFRSKNRYFRRSPINLTMIVISKSNYISTLIALKKSFTWKLFISNTAASRNYDQRMILTTWKWLNSFVWKFRKVLKWVLWCLLSSISKGPVHAIPCNLKKIYRLTSLLLNLDLN